MEKIGFQNRISDMRMDFEPNFRFKEHKFLSSLVSYIQLLSRISNVCIERVASRRFVLFEAAFK